MLGWMDPEKKLSKELVTVFETSEDAEALVVHGLLESAGIEALMTSIYAQQEILPGVGGVVLRVAPEHAAEARRVIEEYSSSPDADSEATEEPEAEP